MKKASLVKCIAFIFCSLLVSMSLESRAQEQPLTKRELEAKINENVVSGKPAYTGIEREYQLSINPETVTSRKLKTVARELRSFKGIVANSYDKEKGIYTIRMQLSAGDVGAEKMKELLVRNGMQVYSFGDNFFTGK